MNPLKELNRLLIYYEDLINDFESTMKKVLLFLKENANSLKEFMRDFEYHKKCSLDYDSQPRFGGSQSKGRDLKCHAKNLSRLEVESIDQYVKNCFPDIHNKYLSQYSRNRCIGYD